MKTIITRSLHSFVLTLAIAFAAPAVMADHHRKPPTILEILQNTDGAQAVVAAVLVVDEAGVLPFSLAELLDDRHAEVVLFAPSNAAFEKLLGLKPGDINDLGTDDDLSIDDVKNALPGIIRNLGLGANQVASILLKHASLPKHANLRTASDFALLARGSVKVADESELSVGIGASGVEINRESTIIKANIVARNGIIHYIGTVIVDDLL